MNNKQFLANYPLERSLPAKEAKAFEKLLKVANESFVLEYTKEKDTKVGNLQYWKFYVHCPMINFADAYAHIGLLWATYVLPIWKKRFSEHDLKNSKDTIAYRASKGIRD